MSFLIGLIVCGIWFGILLKISEVLRLNNVLTAVFLITASFTALVVIAKSSENLPDNSNKIVPTPTSQATQDSTNKTSLRGARELVRARQPVVKRERCTDVKEDNSHPGTVTFQECAQSKSYCREVAEVSDGSHEDRAMLEGVRSSCQTKGW